MNEYGLPKDMPMEDQIEILNKQYRRTTDILGERYPFPSEGTRDFDPRLRIDYLNQFMNDRGITEQNQEVMGSKEQVFPRYANPEDGTLNNEEMARVDPTDKLLLDSLRRGEIGPVTDPRIRKAIIDLERKIYNDGRASSFGGGLFDGALMAADPSFKTPILQNMVGDATERLFPGYKDRRDSLRQQLGLARMKGFV
jgi:hypothetical protein